MGHVLRRRKKRLTGTLFPLKPDPRETVIYNVTQVAAYVGVPRGTLRHWLAKPRKGGRPAIEAADPIESGLSFYNLLEAHILRVATERDAWLSRIRPAVERLREIHPTSAHPLLEEDLFTSSLSRDVFTKTMTGGIEDLSMGGQLVFRPLFARYLSRIDRDRNGPFQLRPYGYQHVAVNYRVSGGRPVVKGTGILLTMIARRNRAGESIESLAQDYNISKSDVRDAIRYDAA